MHAGNGAARLYPSRMHHTFTAAQLSDDDAIKTAIATALTAQTYTGAAINGALAIANVARMRLPQCIMVTTSALAVCYNITDPIVFTGTDFNDQVATVEITLANTNGNEIKVSDTGLYSCNTIYVPAQLKNTGQFKFGVRDVIFPVGCDARQIRHGSDGNIYVAFHGDDAVAPNTTIYRDITPGMKGERHDSFYHRIFGTTDTTSDPVTIYV